MQPGNHEPCNRQPSLFIPFPESGDSLEHPEFFQNPYSGTPHPLCLEAAALLKIHLQEQTEWEHNFGLKKGQEGTVIGKMFGVLVVQNADGIVGYLAGYSGKLAGGYHQSLFVPPVFDGLTEGSFLNEGMEELGRINQKIRILEEENPPNAQADILQLKSIRRQNSAHIQDQIFDSYQFLRQDGIRKNMRDIFLDWNGTKPPSGAGECAGPRLLQYGFEHNLKPLALAEFWWGQSPKSDFWQHEQFYPACKEKCEPILGFMLEGIFS